MAGCQIRFYSLQSPKEILDYGMCNAWFLVMFAVAIMGTIQQAGAAATSLLAGCLYLLYMLNQYRRIFVLHRAPSRQSLIGGYIGSEEDFWRFVKETQTSMKTLERAFCIRFSILPAIVLLVCVLQIMKW